MPVVQTIDRARGYLLIQVSYKIAFAKGEECDCNDAEICGG